MHHDDDEGHSMTINKSLSSDIQITYNWKEMMFTEVKSQSV